MGSAPHCPMAILDFEKSRGCNFGPPTIAPERDLPPRIWDMPSSSTTHAILATIHPTPHLKR